jgi:hypothetical protein
VSHRDGVARWRFDGTTLLALDRAAEQLGWATRPHLVREEAGPGPDQAEDLLDGEPASPAEPPEAQERQRRSHLPSWEHIVEGTPPPNAFPT